MHSTVRNNLVILTHKPVYWDSPIGKLEKNSLVRTMLFPRQQGFDCDSKACLPIAIDYLTTFFAFKQRIIFGMPFANSTAVATPFARMVGINNFKRNLLVKTSGFKQFSKRIEWDTHDFFVESFSFWRKAFKVFNRNIRIKLQSHIGNIPDNFAKFVFDKVVFPCLEFFKTSFGSMTSFIGRRLQFFSSLKNIFSFNPDVFTKIDLLQNLSVWRKNGNSETLAIDINSQNIFSLRQFGFFFGKICNNFKIGSKTIGFALPSVCNKRGIPLEIPIFFYWNSKVFSWVHSKLNKEVGFGSKRFTVTGVVKFCRNTFDRVAFSSPQISDERTSNLNIERGFFLACR